MLLRRQHVSKFYLPCRNYKCEGLKKSHKIILSEYYLFTVRMTLSDESFRFTVLYSCKEYISISDHLTQYTTQFFVQAIVLTKLDYCTALASHIFVEVVLSTVIYDIECNVN